MVGQGDITDVLESAPRRNWTMEIKRETTLDQEIEAAWSKEIERRVAEIAGTVKLVSWEQVREELFDLPADSNT